MLASCSHLYVLADSPNCTTNAAYAHQEPKLEINSALLQFSYSHTSVSHNDTHLLAVWLITPSFVISESGTHPSPIACVEISFQSVLRQFSKSDDANVFANFSSILNMRKRERDLVSKVCEQCGSNGG
jgi:hypothetical protein